MQTLILSSMGSGGSFLELVLPIWIVVLIIYLIDFSVRFIKRKRIQAREKMIRDLTAHIDVPDQDQV